MEVVNCSDSILHSSLRCYYCDIQTKDIEHRSHGRSKTEDDSGLAREKGHRHAEVCTLQHGCEFYAT